jgi:restriction system protein
MKNNPTKSKVSAGLSCGALWTVSKGIKVGDIVLCPNGSGSYYIGEVLDTYSYHSGLILPHRRTVKWYSKMVERSNMSDNLRKSTGSIGTVSEITKYGEEIEQLIGGEKIPTIFL